MTRTQFIDKYRHELAGLVCDAAMGDRHGAALAVFLRLSLKRTDTLLGQMFDSTQPKEPLPAVPPAAEEKLKK